MGDSVGIRRRTVIAAGCVVALIAASVWQIATTTSGQAAGEGGGRAGVLIASAATFPGHGDPGDEVAVLVTRKRSLNRMWDRFELPGFPPVVNFESHRVLFAATGISGSCPEEFRYIERGRDENILKVKLHTAWGPVCTDDWRGHTFVIGASRKHFPRGEFEVRIGTGRTVTVDRR